MPKKLLVMPPPQTGIRSRIHDYLKPGEGLGYDLCCKYTFIWPVTKSVCHLGFRELLDIERGEVTDLTDTYAFDLSHRTGTIKYDADEYKVIKADDVGLPEYKDSNVFVRDPIKNIETDYPFPCEEIVEQFSALDRLHKFHNRMGIRVNALELGNKVTEEVNQIKRVHSSSTPVFIVTDCEYVQAELCAHFKDCSVKPLAIMKQFEYSVLYGKKYIDRTKPINLKYYMLESLCLSNCGHGVINVGGFIGDYTCKNVRSWH